MDQTTAEYRERRTRQEDAEWNSQYQDSLKSAIDKVYRALEPGRRRAPAFDKTEFRALQMFIRKHYNE